MQADWEQVDTMRENGLADFAQRSTIRGSRNWFASIAVLLLAASLTACAGGEDFLEPAEPNGHHPFPERSATLGRNAHQVHGIDIAKYQGNIDWHKVKQSGVAFAFIKATEGTDRLDRKFAENWAAAKAAGVARGAYHFNYWCTSFKDQFNWFRRNVPRDKDAMPPVLDLEWNTHSPTCPRKVSRARAQREIRTFVRLAEAWYGKRPILYADIRFYRDVLSDGSFSQYPLWLRATRRLPQDIYKGRKWVFWQYSDRSRVPGIRGRVDKNAFAGSPREWKQLVAANFNDPRRVTPQVTPDKKSPVKSAPQPAMVAQGENTKVNAGEVVAVVTGEAGKPAQNSPGAKPQEKKQDQKQKPTAVIQVTTARTRSSPAVRAGGKSAKAGKPLSLAPINLLPNKPKAVATR